MVHFFDTDVACAVGIEAAIIFNNIGHWVTHNRENDHNFYDGSYWTFNSTKAFEKQLPYMSYQKIGRALLKLEEMGLIISGHYNQSAFDKTKWYTLTETGYSIYQNENIDLSNLINRTIKFDQPIPYINTYINTNNKHTYEHSQNARYPKDDFPHEDSPNPNDNYPKDVEGFFNSVWACYPKKKGKGQVSHAKKVKLFNLGYDVVTKCVERYVSEFKASGQSDQFMMYGSTFFNSGYVDYLDENYSQEDVTITTKEGAWQ